MQPENPPESSNHYVVDTPYEVARWRPLVNWILVIPHTVIVTVMGYLWMIVVFFYWWALLFTGRLNPGMYGFFTMVERYNVRMEAFLLGFSRKYPPFSFKTGADDDGAYPGVTLDLPALPAKTPRRNLFNWVLAIPHYIVLWVLSIGAMIVLIVGWFAVLILGRWPQGMRDFLVRLTNYHYRVWVYSAMVETSYPRFGLNP